MDTFDDPGSASPWMFVPIAVRMGEWINLSSPNSSVTGAWR